MSPLAERTRAQVAAHRPARSTAPSRAGGGSSWATSTRRPSSRTRWPPCRRRRAGGRPDRVVGLVLAPHYSRGVGRRVPRARRRGRRASTACPTRRSSRGTSLAAWRDAQAARVRAGAGRPARRDQGAVHRPLAARAGARGRPLPRRAAHLGRRHRGPGRASTAGTAGRWPGSRPAAPPSRGGAPTWPRSSATWAAPGGPRACSCARRGSCPTTSRCCTTSTSTPAGWRGEAGLAFARTASINDEPAVMTALAELVRSA